MLYKSDCTDREKERFIRSRRRRRSIIVIIIINIIVCGGFRKYIKHFENERTGRRRDSERESGRERERMSGRENG